MSKQPDIKILKEEIDYLKYLQEHNIFNYNVNNDLIRSLYSISISGLLVFLSLVLLIITFYYNFSLNQNYNILFLFGSLSLIAFFLGLMILDRYKEAKDAIKSTQRAFERFHIRIQEKCETIGLNIKSLSE